QLNATESVRVSFVYSSVAGAFLHAVAIHTLPTAATSTDDANHDGANDANAFTVAKATLTVDANPNTKVYGADDPTLGYTLHGFVGGTDNADNSSITGTGTCTRALGETVPGSPYAITCTPGTGLTALSSPNSADDHTAAPHSTY